MVGILGNEGVKRISRKVEYYLGLAAGKDAQTRDIRPARGHYARKHTALRSFWQARVSSILRYTFEISSYSRKMKLVSHHFCCFPYAVKKWLRGPGHVDLAREQGSRSGMLQTTELIAIRYPVEQI